jgi:hypothetical protein
VLAHAIANDHECANERASYFIGFMFEELPTERFSDE